MSALIDDLNLLDGSWYADDPHTIFDEMRSSAPVHYDPVGAVWGIFKHADVLAVEKDAKTFSSHRAPRPQFRNHSEVVIGPVLEIRQPDVF